MRTQRSIIHSLLLWLAVTAIAGTPLRAEQWKPASRTSSGIQSLTAFPLNLLNPEQEAVLRWVEAPAYPVKAYFRFGRSPEDYSLGSVLEVADSALVRFTPSQVGLGQPGVYYGVVTNSPDATIDQTEHQSQEFLVFIEAQVTAELVAPKGTIQDPTPLFQWHSVDGVPFYHVMVSDEPVEITEDSTGAAIVKGANLIWQVITPGNSIRYGEIDPSGFFTATNGEVPLMKGVTYNYLVLNNYGNHPLYTSAVQAGVTEFVVNVQSQLAPPVLVSPADSAVIRSDVITFRWDPVTGAVNYKLSLFELRLEDGSEITFPVYETTTTNTLVDLPAKSLLLNARYSWKIIAWDETGGGAQSETRIFEYRIPIGTMTIYTQTTAGAELPRVEVLVEAISGSSETLPLVTGNYGNITRIMHPGTYRLTATKEGFERTTKEVTLTEDWDLSSTEGDVVVVLHMPESPAIVTGKAIDDAGAPLELVVIRGRHVLSGEERTVLTDADGYFLIGLASGTWEIFAEKAGYVAATSKIVTLAPGASKDLTASPFQLKLDAGTLEIVVKNVNGSPITGVMVTASRNNESMARTTSSNGVANFTLASGTWRTNVAKTGYLSPSARDLLVSRGNATSAEFILQANANLISGSVRDASRALSGVTITATPQAGAPTTATTNTIGQYTLSLGSGTFVISAFKEGYTASSPVQLTVEAGESIQGVNFILSPNPSAISGRVTSDGQNGVAGATVTNGTVTTTTASTGSYTLSLPEGAHSVYATKSGYATSATTNISLLPGQSLSDLDFIIAPNAASISGRVTSNGLGVSQAIVVASNADRKYEVATDADGAFTLNVQPQSYTLIAKKNGFVTSTPQNVTANPGQSITGVQFALIENLASLRGVITGAGESLRSATVVATDSLGNATSTTSNVDGSYNMRLVAGISYLITASKSGFATGKLSFPAASPGASVVRDFNLSPLPSTITGKVTSRSGAPHAAATIAADTFKTTTQLDGTYRLDVPAGTWNLQVTKIGYAGNGRSVTLVYGQTVENVDFTLTGQANSLSGSIQSNGQPLGNVLISLLDATGNVVYSSQSSVAGTYSITSIVSGSYLVRFEKNRYAKLDTTIAFSNNAALTADFSLKELKGRIAGMVSSNEGPLAGVTVTATGTDGSFFQITNAQGEYNIPGLSLVSHSVTAALADYTSPPPASNVVPDSLHLNFVMQRNVATLRGRVLAGESGVARALVSARGSRGNAGSASTNQSGEYVMSNLAEDEYRLGVDLAGFTLLDTAVIVPVANGEETQQDLHVAPDTLVVSGTVRDANGPLSSIAVVLNGKSGELLTSTNQDGYFEFSALPAYSRMNLKTRALTAGLVDRDTTFTIGLGSIRNLTMLLTRNDAELSGNTSIAEVTVTATASDQRTFSTTSLSTGAYALKNLPAGEYRVQASKRGHLVNPEEVVLSLAGGEKKSLDFALTRNMGNLSGSVKNALGAPIPNAGITTVAEGTGVSTATTDSTGTFAINDLIAGKTYTVVASLSGWTSEPSEHQVEIQRDATTSVDFVLEQNRSAVAGLVVRQGSNAPLAEVTVSLLSLASGEVKRMTTDGTGRYGFYAIAAGHYTVTPERAGFTSMPLDSTITVEVADTVSIDWTMDSQNGSFAGKLLYQSQPIAGATINMRGATTFTKKTGGSGQFEFGEVPAGSYELEITKEGLRVFVVQAITVEKNKRLNLPIDLPSGRVVWRFVDHDQPVPGVSLQITQPVSQTFSVLQQGQNEFRGELRGGVAQVLASSDTSGQAESDSSLFAGTYYVAVKKDGYLSPQVDDLKFELVKDERKVVVVPLIFRHTPIGSASAGDTITFRISTNAALPADSISAIQLSLRRPGSTLVQLYDMARMGSDYVYALPPVAVSGRLTYSLSAVYRDGRVWHCRSEEFGVDLNLAGVLRSLAVIPGEGVLQKDIETEIVMRPYDDLANVLSTDVEGRGTVAWAVLSGDSTAALRPSPITPRRILVTPRKEGTIRLGVTVQLDGVTLSKETTFTSRKMELANIKITAPPPVNNSSPYQFSFVAVSTDSQLMRINSVWKISPELAGTVTNDGLFTPNPEFLGEATVTIKDVNSAVEKLVAFSLFATIDSTTARQFRDESGMTLSIPASSVSRRKEISLAHPKIPDVKRFTPEFQISGQIYKLLPSGLVLNREAEITVPLGNTQAGEQKIGAWDQLNLEWKALETQSASGANVSALLREFAQITVLTQNQPLGIQGLSFLPTPFSPKRGPMRIAYVLTTQNRQAVVSIKVYNMAGTLVRTIAEREPQYPGIHKELEIAWDGLTDAGELARNGRYIVELVVEDVDGKKRDLATVVLVK